MDDKQRPVIKHVKRIETTTIILFVVAVLIVEPLYIWVRDNLRKLEELDVQVEQVQEKLDRKIVIEPRQSKGGGTSLPPEP